MNQSRVEHIKKRGNWRKPWQINFNQNLDFFPRVRECVISIQMKSVKQSERQHSNQVYLWTNSFFFVIFRDFFFFSRLNLFEIDWFSLSTFLFVCCYSESGLSFPFAASFFIDLEKRLNWIVQWWWWFDVLLSVHCVYCC